MKKLILIFALLVSVSSGYSQVTSRTVTASRIGSDKSSEGVIDAPDSEITSETDYSSTYKVAGFSVVRIMLNIVDEREWVKYHMLVENDLRILFLNPPRDFDEETLIAAFNTWDNIGIPESGIVVFNNPESDADIDIYVFSQENKWMLTKQEDGIVCYTIGNAVVE
jgi:hypothetical protein